METASVAAQSAATSRAWIRTAGGWSSSSRNGSTGGRLFSKPRSLRTRIVSVIGSRNSRL